MKKSHPARPYLIIGGIGLLMTAGVLSIRGIASLTDALQIYSALCDAFFVPGIILLCLGLLVLVAGTGQFDMLNYGMHSLLVLFTPFRKAEKHESFFDFKMAREEKRKLKPKPYLLQVGAVFMALAVICLLLYMLQGGMNT